MAGTINLALSQQFDTDGRPLSGGKLYFFVAASTVPQTAFQDIGLTIPWPNPIILDASGRVPMFYLADGNIKIRLDDKNGVVVIAADNLLVIGPSGATSGGGGVDATQLLQTGDIIARFGTGPHNGFLPCNGLAIGRTGSAAPGLASDDLARALFQYLWTTPLPLLDHSSSPLTKTTASADFNAGWWMPLPDLRGRTIAGMDDMGTAAASRLTATYFGVGGTTLGNAGGDEKHSLVLGNLPTYTPSGSVAVSFTPEGSNAASSLSGGSAAAQGISIPTFNVTLSPGASQIFAPVGSAGSTSTGIVASASTVTGTCDAQTFTGRFASSNPGPWTIISTGFTGTTLNPGGATAHATTTPSMVMTFYIKL